VVDLFQTKVPTLDIMGTFYLKSLILDRFSIKTILNQITKYINSLLIRVILFKKYID